MAGVQAPYSPPSVGSVAAGGCTSPKKSPKTPRLLGWKLVTEAPPTPSNRRKAGEDASPEGVANAKEEFKAKFRLTKLSHLRSILSYMYNLHVAIVLYKKRFATLPTGSRLRFSPRYRNGAVVYFDVTEADVKNAEESYKKGLSNLYYYTKYRGSKARSTVAKIESDKGFYKRVKFDPNGPLGQWVRNENFGVYLPYEAARGNQLASIPAEQPNYAGYEQIAPELVAALNQPSAATTELRNILLIQGAALLQGYALDGTLEKLFHISIRANRLKNPAQGKGAYISASLAMVGDGVNQAGAFSLPATYDYRQLANNKREKIRQPAGGPSFINFMTQRDAAGMPRFYEKPKDVQQPNGQVVRTAAVPFQWNFFKMQWIKTIVAANTAPTTEYEQARADGSIQVVDPNLDLQQQQGQLMWARMRLEFTIVHNAYASWKRVLLSEEASRATRRVVVTPRVIAVPMQQ